MLIEKGMTQSVNEYTHTRQGSESMIDLVFTNAPEKVKESGTVNTGSEHKCVWMNRELKRIVRDKEIMKRSLKNSYSEALLDQVRTIN